MPAENVDRAVRDVKAVLKEYDTDGDGKLNDAELSELKLQYANKRGDSYEILRKRYDVNDDGDLDDGDLQRLQEDMHLMDSPLRYLAYAGVVARSARYFRVVFKGVAHPYFLKGSYAAAWTVVAGDAYVEATCAQRHGATNNEMAIVAVKRVTFNALASIFFPMYTMQAINRISTPLFSRFSGNLATYGPTAAAFATVPLLPYMWDRPVMAAVNMAFPRLEHLHE